MSRHRNIRTLDADEEYDDFHSVYGHSFEDDFCVSPGTESQFLYNRATRNQNTSIFESPEPVPEESDDECLNVSDSSRRPSNLSDLDSAKLQSCLEALQDIVAETIPESTLQTAAIENNFDLECTLNAVLKDQAPKPPRNKKADSFTETSKGTSISSSIKKKGKSDANTPKSSQKVSKTKFSEKQNVESPKFCRKQQSISKTPMKSLDESTISTPQKNELKPFLTDKEKSNTPILESDTSINLDDQKSYKSKSSRVDKNGKEIYEKERKDSKPLINLVVIGHVDAGKSTLMGHLLFSLGNVSQKNMHKFEKESQKLGKGSFKYAWVLDETPEERTRGITMDVALSSFETTHRCVNLLDAPGHKDFIPNMITGAAQADVAILVVDATRGEFETGFEAGGQTREHTMLIRSLGVGEITVAINKMDNVGWAEGRFTDIKSKMSTFLKQVGFKENDVTFVPCSGLSGDNLIDRPKELNWYCGPTLVEAINNFQPPERPIDKPFRMCVGDVFKGMTGGFSADGRIEAGFVKSGDKVVIMPAAEQTIVKGVSVDDKTIAYGFAGDHVIITFSNIDPNNISSGSMICSIEDPIKVTARFEACLVIFNISVPITKGYPVILHYQSLCEQAIIKKLISQISRTTGEVIKRKPRCIVKNSSAIVVIEVNHPICIELSKEFKSLGRFMLRTGGSTIAAGLVTKIL